MSGLLLYGAQNIARALPRSAQTTPKAEILTVWLEASAVGAICTGPVYDGWSCSGCSLLSLAVAVALVALVALDVDKIDEDDGA